MAETCLVYHHGARTGDGVALTFDEMELIAPVEWVAPRTTPANRILRSR